MGPVIPSWQRAKLEFNNTPTDATTWSALLAAGPINRVDSRVDE